MEEIYSDIKVGTGFEPMGYESCTLPISYTEKMEKISSKQNYKSDIGVLAVCFIQPI